MHLPITHNNLYFATNRPHLYRSLSLSPSVYVWCVVGENKEMKERRRQTKRVWLKPNVCRIASFTIVENQHTRGRIYPVLYFDRHSLH
jgi:hypothetical protein